MIVLSLKSRVILAVVGVLVVSVMTVSFVTYGELKESLIRDVDQTLTARASGIRDVLRSGLDEAARPDWEYEVRTIVKSGGRDRPSIYRVWLEGSQQDLLASDPPGSERKRWLLDVPRPDASGKAQPAPVDIGPQDAEYRGLWLQGETADGTVYNVVMGESSRYAHHEMAEFRDFLLVVAGCVLLTSGVLVYAMVQWGLRPIGGVADRLREVTHQNLGDQDLGLTAVPSELRPFVGSTEDLLRRLNRAFRRQKQFTADAAHELRTPLTVVKSTLQTAELMRTSGREDQQVIQESLEDLARMERLIEQLLALARMDETEAQPTGFTEVRLDELLSEIAHSHDAAASGLGGTVAHGATPPITVRGNVEELRRLFDNIVENAVVHGPAGGTVSIEVEAEPAGHVTVSVRDEGEGIAPEALPHLFDRFYRADASRSRTSGGAGLGLSIAREIALRHNGDITVASSEPTGTTVSVRLPKL